MDCLKCNLSFDENANFCQKCGSDLSKFESFLKEKIKRYNDDKLLLLLVGLDLFTTLIWFAFSQVIAFFSSDYQYAYKYFSWFVTFLTLSIFLLVTIKVKNNNIRNFLIGFLVLKIIIAGSYELHKLL